MLKRQFFERRSKKIEIAVIEKTLVNKAKRHDKFI
jgi:hypothetical protein